MGNKKAKSKKAAASKNQNESSTQFTPAGPSNTPSTPPPETATPPAPSEVDEEEIGDVKERAENIKEKGNVAFKAGKYQDAIEQYTQAIGLNSSEPAFLTNRAAAYMSIKKFRPALDDCQHAASLQSASPSPKTLLRLARCQLALGSAAAAASTLRIVLELDPKNAAAIQFQAKISELEKDLSRFEEARSKKEWGMARLALDRCFSNIESQGDEIPSEWNAWRIELELSKGNIEGANSAANDALRMAPNSPETLTLRGLVFFINGKLPQALQHTAQALRFDPSYEPAQKLRKRTKEVEKLKDEGNALFKSGQHEPAIAKYTEALEVVGAKEEEGKGGNIRATLLSNRATTFVKLAKYQEALEDADISIELVGNSFKALRTRARIHLALDNFDKATMDFKSAIMEAQKDGAAGDADVRALRNELKKAEAALKRSKTKDYYKILGLQRECTESEIKKAYRRESLKHHPDKGGDEEKFKLVVEANAVLSDPGRRERYDMGDDEDGMNDGMSGMGGMPHGMSQADIAELFAQFGGGGGPFRSGGGGFGGGRQPGGFSFTFG